MRFAAAFDRARPGLAGLRTPRGPTRFGTLGALAVLAVLLLSPGGSNAAGVCDAPIANEIACENSKPGAPADEWEVPEDETPAIEGYTTEFSVDQGETLRFKIKTNASAYRLDIYRLGYYGGDGARKVATVTPTVSLPQTQPACLTQASTRLIDCGNWAVSASWTVPGDAVSGIYVGRPVRLDNGAASHIPFVVRDDDGHSDVLFQTSDTTWQAYNNYGGNSLYHPPTTERGFKVSYNRPFATRFNGHGRDYFFSAEYPMVRWLERNGYDVSYTSGIDSDRRGSELLEHRAFLSVGHDEYWSGGQRANVEAARAAGVNLGFFSGNEVFWKTRWEPSIDGTSTSHRTLVCYKETREAAKIDPSPLWTGTWRDPRFSPPSDGGRPENELTGTLFMVNAFRDDAMKVPAEYGDLRFWRNTNIATLQPGQQATFPQGTLGHEWDEDVDNGFRPAGLVRLSSTTYDVDSYVTDYGAQVTNGRATHSLTLYRASSGALVFGAGTVQWAFGLDPTHDYPGAPTDQRMKQATINLFADMGVQPSTIDSSLTPATASADSTPPTSTITSPASGASLPTGQAVTITGTASDTGGVVAGVEVSVDGGATWRRAVGRQNWTYTWTSGPSQSTTIKSRAVDDSVNMETPSAGVPITVTQRSCPCSIWAPSTTPQTPATSDTASYELGVKFRTEVPGYITGLRFYKGSGNTGTHVGHLWSASGTQLATATFTNETATGWQQVNLGTPVAVAANTTYVASYFAPAGRYALDRPYFTTAYINPPLQALADGAGGGNGVYAVGGGFPDSSSSASNYWVDVVFERTLPGDTTPPTVTSVVPTSGATGVGAHGNVTAQFSEAVDPASVTSATFELRDPGGVPVPAATSASGSSVTLDPSSALTASTTYTAKLKGGSTGIKDLGGNALSADYVWSFTTGLPDTTPPTVTSVSPPAGATGASRNAPITADFSEALDPASVTAASFELRAPGGALVTANVSASGSTATLSPSAALAYETTYTATLKGGGAGVKDQAGNPLGSDYSWSFTTTAPAACPCSLWDVGTTPGTPATLDSNPFELGVRFQADVAGYVTGIRFYKGTGNTGTHLGRLWSATGTQLANATFTNETATGWQQVIFATPVAIAANTTYVASYFAPAGHYALDRPYFTTGYDNAPLHALADGAGGGNGVYAFGGGFPVESSMASNYWVDVVFLRTLPADTTPPTVASVVPASGATGVGASVNVRGVMSEALDPASVTAGSFELRNAGGALVPAAVSASGATATLDPSTALTPTTTYTATLKGGPTGVKDQAGNPLATDYSWSFTTAAPAACPCSLWSTSTTPGTAATLDTSPFELGVRFQSDDAGYVTGIRFYKGPGNSGTHVGHLWSATGTLLATATFTNETATGWQQVSFATPVAIAANTTYVASYFAPAGHYALDRPYFTETHDSAPLRALADGDGGGNGVYAFGGGFPVESSLASNYWVDLVFERTLALDTTPPTVASVTPTAGAPGVGASVNARAVMSEALDPASVTASSFELRNSSGALVPAAVSASGSSATLDPSAMLNASTTYTATLKGGSVGVKDQAGNPLGADYSWSFTTAAPATCPCSLWSASVVPTTVEVADATPFELGVRFQSDVDGYVTGIRFYKGAGNTGTHVGHLWTSAGQLLATATFTNETATGWQQVNFADSVAVTAGTTYVASYFAPAGHYAVDRPYFGTTYDNAPLHAPADGAGGGNGVYHAFGSGFPTSSSEATNYWVDVVFNTSPTDTTSPTSTTTFPAASGSYNIAGWTAGCAVPGFCGTASDLGSGLQKVELSIQRGTGNYWNGSAFTSATEVFVAATGTATWNYAFARTSFPADGQYIVRMRATDVAGNAETPVARTFTYDAATPTSSATFPVASTSYSASSWNAGCTTPGVCGTASDLTSSVQKVELSIRRGSGNYWNGSAFASATEVFHTATGTAAWSYPLPATSFPADGQYTIRLRATDAAGNVQAPVSRAFTYDGNGPAVTATFPAASGNYNLVTWAAGCVPSGFCGTASDPTSGVQRVELSIRKGAGSYWDGTAFSSASEVFVPATGTTAWNYSFPPTNFPVDDQYTIRVRGIDASGNTTLTPLSRTFRFDTLAATSTMSFPANSALYRSATWTPGCPTAGFCGTAVDPTSGVQRVQLSVRQGTGNYWNGTSFGSAGEVWINATGTTSWNLAFPASRFTVAGSYTVSVRATDNAGNVEAPTSRTFDYDGTAPTSAVTFPVASGAYNAAGWGSSSCPTPGMCGTASDAASGVQKVEISIRQVSPSRYWNGTSFASSSEIFHTATGTTAWSFPLAASSLVVNGQYTLRVRATDSAGNVQSPSSLTFRYDAALPTATLTFPAANGSYTSTTWNAGCTSAVCGSASDTGGSGLARVEVSIVRQATGSYWDGTAFASPTEVYVQATLPSPWRFAFPATSFPSAGSYVVRARATDAAGNTGNPSAPRTFNFTP